MRNPFPPLYKPVDELFDCASPRRAAWLLLAFFPLFALAQLSFEIAQACALALAVDRIQGPAAFCALAPACYFFAAGIRANALWLMPGLARANPQQSLRAAAARAGAGARTARLASLYFALELGGAAFEPALWLWLISLGLLAPYAAASAKGLLEKARALMRFPAGESHFERKLRRLRMRADPLYHDASNPARCADEPLCEYRRNAALFALAEQAPGILLSRSPQGQAFASWMLENRLAEDLCIFFPTFCEKLWTPEQALELAECAASFIRSQGEPALADLCCRMPHLPASLASNPKIAFNPFWIHCLCACAFLRGARCLFPDDPAGAGLRLAQLAAGQACQADAKASQGALPFPDRPELFLGIVPAARHAELAEFCAKLDPKLAALAEASSIGSFVPEAPARPQAKAGSL